MGDKCIIEMIVLFLTLSLLCTSSSIKRHHSPINQLRSFVGGLPFSQDYLGSYALKDLIFNVSCGGEMYAETGVLFPHFQNFSQVQQIEEFWKTQKPNASLTTICDYDMGGEGGLFEAPKPIIEEPVVPIDLVLAAISMISCGEDVISSQGLKVSDFESYQNNPLLSDVFYECKKDMLEKAAMETLLSGANIPENKSIFDAPFQKSISSESLTSMEGMNGGPTIPGFLDFQGVDMSSVCRIRRAFSDGDIKTLCCDRIGITHSILTIEERKEKLLRYRNKKSKRNYGRKIKYACRKALADSQQRIRGRFAKTEECDAKRK